MNYKDPDFLKSHIKSIVEFYYPVCLDNEYGGYINQLRDDGSVFDRMTKHLVGTCRFVYIFSIASIILDNKEYSKAAAHGIRFLTDWHRQNDGGFSWLLNGRNVADPTRHCYGHAFVLLAAASAMKAGVEGSAALMDDIWELLEMRFWEADAQLYVDEINADDWSLISPYRGQNANMHMCESMLTAYEASGQNRYLDRAALLAKRICVDLAESTDGLVWEHYKTDWSNDWKYNLDNPKHLFRPYGYLPGHFVEWSKLLLILNRYRPEEWQLKGSILLFETAVEKAWDSVNGGMNYTFSPEGEILDTDRYYWVLSEMIGASALLALKTGENKYWDWYNRAWEYSDKYFIDHSYGGWYRILDQYGKKYTDEKSPASKTDYHPLAACYEVLEALKQQ